MKLKGGYKIGKIPYLNLLPIFYYLENHISEEIEFIEGSPKEVNNLLKEGSIEISPSSSVVYLLNKEEIDFIPGHSISSFGPVMSILFVSKRPIGKGHPKVALSPYSETSNLLLKVILNRFYNLTPRYTLPPRQDMGNLDSADGALFIGDDALKLWACPPEGLYLYDLGEIWYKETGLPAVFALWLYKRNNKERATGFKTLLDRARQWALTHLEEIAETPPLKETLGKEGIINYWNNLSYDLSEEHLKGLELFGRYIGELQGTT